MFFIIKCRMLQLYVHIMFISFIFLKYQYVRNYLLIHFFVVTGKNLKIYLEFLQSHL